MLKGMKSFCDSIKKEGENVDDSNIKKRSLRFNMKKTTHKQAYEMLETAECSGNQLIIDALLYYRKNYFVKDGFSAMESVNYNESNDSDMKADLNYVYVSD